MDIISAYREVGSYRGAAAFSGTTEKTVKRAIARHESDGAPPARVPREHNYDAVTELVACGPRVSIWSSTGVSWAGCMCSARCW